MNRTLTGAIHWFLESPSDLQSGTGDDRSPAASGSAEPPPSAPGGGAGGGCLRKRCREAEVVEQHWTGAARLTAVEGLGGSLQHLQGQSGHDVRLPSDGLGSLHGLRPQRGDHLGPVDQRQTL